MKTETRFYMAVIALVLGAAVPAVAQQPGRPSNPEGLQLTRQDLQELLVQAEQTAETSSGQTRQHAQENAVRIRQRLQEGDFRAGDRIMLQVRQEPGMSGEFTVEPGRTITIPEVGSVSVAGVLRSELESHLRQELGRYLQNPSLSARSLIRVAVLGEVGSPGFFSFPASMVLEDVVMEAGGPTRSANLDRIRIERAGDAIWRDGPLQQAMRDARTLDQLSLQAGDRIIVPSRGQPVWRTALTVVTTAGSLLWLYRRVSR